MANKREISHLYLPGKTKYEFCPHCIKKMEEEGVDWKEKLKPLKFVKTAEPVKCEDGTYRDYIDSHYECIRCGVMNITTETFRMYYCARSDGTKYTEPIPSKKNVLCFLQTSLKITLFGFVILALIFTQTVIIYPNNYTITGY